MKYIWKINGISCIKTYQNKNNVVVKVNYHFSIQEIISDTEGYYAAHNGNVDLDYKNISEFTEYNDLSEEQVLLWVKDSLGQDKINSIEKKLLSEISQQKGEDETEIISNPLPF